jgi:hypothetical protein
MSFLTSSVLADAIPDSVVDNFEEVVYEDENKTLSDYYNNGDLTSFSRQTTTVYEQSYALKNTATAAIESNSGLPNYVNKNDTVQVALNTESGERAGFSFMNSGISDGIIPTEGYWISQEQDSNLWILAERFNKSNEVKTLSTTGVNAGQWYRIELSYDGTDLTAEIFDGNGTSLETLTITPNNDLSSNDGIFFGSRTSGIVYYDDVFIV